MKAVSLNYRDLMIVRGTYAPDLRKPRIIGSDGAGEVVAVGEGVVEYAVGDRVAGTFFQGWIDGTFSSDYLDLALGGATVDGVLTTARVFDQGGLIRIPQQLTYAEAATLPCAGVAAWHGLVSTAHIRSGETVLVLGTGGVSMFGLQFAKMHGARVILTSSSDEKLSRAKALGADCTINYTKHPEWSKEVLKLTNGEGADVVLETGGAGTLSQSISSVRSGGQVSLIGILTGISEQLNILPIVGRSIRVQGINVGSAAMLKEMSRAIAINGIKPVINRVFRFEQSRDALKYMETKQHMGKLVISIGDV
jgi:NADPH:quinone reductase-like Zn-dependent oxidoreductase